MAHSCPETAVILIINIKTIKHMKKLMILLSAMALTCSSFGQSCDKKSCGPEDTKKGEAAAVTSLRSDLQTALNKMSRSSVAFDPAVLEMEIAQGGNDDESLLYISHAAAVVREELITKVEPAKVLSDLKEYKSRPGSTKQQMMAGLKTEVRLLVNQTERL